MTDRELMQQSLEALENVRRYDKENLYGLDDDIAALRKRLSESVAQPVAWMVWDDNNVPSLTFTKPADKYVFDALYMSPQPAQQEPVAFLANGTRFKMSFFENEDEPGTHVTCFEAFEKELDGRWVALVAAEDDSHLKLTSPPASKPWVGLDAGDWNKIAYTSEFRAGADWADALLREKNA